MEGLGSGGEGGARRRHRRSLSCPTSLESLCEHALSLETTPCSVLQLHALDDEVAAGLRRTLHETQQEILAAVEAGVLARGGGAAVAAGGRRTTSDSGGAASDAEDRQRSGGAASGSGATGAMHQREECLIDEGELAGLSARERELAIKRAKNREAARRSRERKVERIAGLQAEVDALRNNNFVLLKCIEEVAQKALAARAEQKQLRDKLAHLHGQPAGPLPAAPGPSSAAECTPPPARRAAALERQLQRMEEEAASPTHLLLPHWPGGGGGGGAPPAATAALHQPRPHLPTSAELRRQLQDAVAGGLGSCGAGGSSGSSGNNSAGSSGEKKAADREHHLHPSPQRLHSSMDPGLDAFVQPQLRPHAAVLQLRHEGPGLLRSCSAPGGLLAGAAAGVGMAEGGAAAPPLDWFRGVAA